MTDIQTLLAKHAAAMVPKQKARRFWLPHWTPLLHLQVEVPGVSLRAALCYYCFDSMETEYIAINGRVWKWRVGFALYGRRR